MKLNNILVIIKISLVLCLLNSGSAFKTQKEMNMLEFMNGFYSSDKKAENLILNAEKKSHESHHESNPIHKAVAHKLTPHLKTKKHHAKVRSRHNNFRFKSMQNGTAAPGGAAGNQTLGEFEYNQILLSNQTFMGSNSTPAYPKPASPNIFIEGELFISSETFKNVDRFPPVLLKNGTMENIVTDPDNFRINRQGCEGTTCKLNFYFRLAPDLHLYYSSYGKDLNVLGSISIKNMIKVSDPLAPYFSSCGMTYCFNIEDTVNSEWKLCAKSWKAAMQWVCAIKKALDVDDPTCASYDKNIVIIEKKIKEPIVIIPLPSPHCNENWNYQQRGDDWECECIEGVEQSPIDLPLAKDCIDSPVRPLTAYNDIDVKSPIETIEKVQMVGEAMKIELFKNALRIFNHNMGKVTTIDGAVYHAEEIVFHTPSQHSIDGKFYDMEIEIIHYGQSVGDIAKQLSLNFVIKKKPGVYNKFFESIDVFNLPDPINKQKPLINNLYIPNILFTSDDTETPMMKPYSFYTYQGSLSSPPCNERTIVYVASRPVELSTTQITLFQEALRVPDLVDPKGNIIVSDQKAQSARKTQELNGRPIFYYDHEKYCGPDLIPKVPEPKGHYEKVQQKATNYFYVNGEKPSGLPGAFVVTEKEAKGTDPQALGANS